MISHYILIPDHLGPRPEPNHRPIHRTLRQSTYIFFEDVHDSPTPFQRDIEALVLVVELGRVAGIGSRPIVQLDDGGFDRGQFPNER